METRYYLAYGSNLNTEQMRYRCPTARIVGTAVVKDYRLLFKGSRTGAYLTIEPMKGASVPVAIWSVTSDDEARLDRYEGYPSFYYKAEMTVSVKGIRTGKSSRRKAFVYIMSEGSVCGRPSVGYFRTCRDGYDAFGFDRQTLINAYNDSVKE